MDILRFRLFHLSSVGAEALPINYSPLFTNTVFGLEYLSEDLAQMLAKFPSYFLHFDRITNLPESVACQFIGSRHALTFDGCSEFSPATLRALAKSASFLSIGLSELSVEQAKALANFHLDLVLRADQLPPDVLFALGENVNPCLAPDYGIIRLSDE